MPGLFPRSLSLSPALAGAARFQAGPSEPVHGIETGKGGMTLTPAERQEMLRRLKHGPVMDREVLAVYALKVRDKVLEKRKES